MADDNMTTSDNATTVDAMMFKPPTVLVPSDEKEEEETTKLEDNPPKDITSNSSVESTTTLLANKRKPKSATYGLENFFQHAMLVLNHRNIKRYKKPRYGTEKDVKALHDTFSKLGFIPEVKPDPSREKVMKEVKEFCSRDFSKHGCVAVVVLTHGLRNGDLFASDGLLYNERDIIEYLKCSYNPTLERKPRILVLQACRGFDISVSNTKGVKVHVAESICEESPEDEPDLNDFDPNAEIKHYFLPLESNMLVVHSSYLGKNSFRNEATGSWLIQALCKKINELASSLDLESILTEMQREVAIERQYSVYLNRTSERYEHYKQMPVTTSTFSRKLYLRHRAKLVPRYLAEPFKRRSEQTASVSDAQLSQADQNLSSAAPPPPLDYQLGPCFCFLDRYYYMLNCLKCYLEHHSDDDAAKMCFNVASKFEHGQAFFGTKEEMLRSISKRLFETSFKYHKYMHFYN